MWQWLNCFQLLGPRPAVSIHCVKSQKMFQCSEEMEATSAPDQPSKLPAFSRSSTVSSAKPGPLVITPALVLGLVLQVEPHLFEVSRSSVPDLLPVSFDDMKSFRNQGDRLTDLKLFGNQAFEHLPPLEPLVTEGVAALQRLPLSAKPLCCCSFCRFFGTSAATCLSLCRQLPGR